jgi:hypothetical protein
MDLLKHIIGRAFDVCENYISAERNRKLALEKETLLREYLVKEVDLIQSVIKRMASNSFLMKGWTVTLVVGSLLLNGNKNHVLIAFIPLIVFWYLDAYFLWQERMYRQLYKWVIENRLKTDEHLFDLNAYRFRDKVSSRWGVMFSDTLLPFYVSIAILLFIYLFVLTPNVDSSTLPINNTFVNSSVGGIK